MSIQRFRASIFWGLVSIATFNALSAIGGGIGLIVADGLSMPKSLLAETPFTTFAIPGVILLVLVGGTQLVTAVLLLRTHESALLWSAVAGFGMLIWIITEIGFIHAFTYAQTIYVVSGLIQLVLVFALLGIAEWLPRGRPLMRRSSQKKSNTATAPCHKADSPCPRGSL